MPQLSSKWKRSIVFSKPMKNLIIIFLIVCWVVNIKAQRNGLTVTGKISYISSQNVYVKFESTKDLKAGDTLYIKEKNDLIPALIVNNLSSTSCVCVPVSKINLLVSGQVYAKKNITKEDNEIKLRITIPEDKQVENDTSEYTEKKKEEKPEFVQKISGSIAASSYSYFSGSEKNNTSRFRYQLSLNAKNISNSKFSAELYSAFQHEKDKWRDVQENVFQALKIYNLSVIYNNNKNTQFVLGRRINPKLSSIGAIDGLQYEGNSKSIFWGLIAGSRPNYIDYKLDFDLLQFGLYGGHNFSNSNGKMQNSFAFVEQMNAMKTDRRFAYYQQSNSLIKNLYFFGSVEIELYKNINDHPENTFNLSSTYLVLNYRLFKKFTLSGSYDNRKNIIYYESYKSFINQILEIEARQGLSFRANYYNLKNLTFGIKTGYHFSNRNAKESKNLYGFVSYSNIPVVKLTVTGAVNYLETSYVTGKILNLNISRDILQGNLYIDCGYQFIDYQYLGTETTSIQNLINIYISWRFLKKNSFSVNYETTFEQQDQYNRLNLQIRKRF